LYLCEISHKKYRTTCCSWWSGGFESCSLRVFRWKLLFYSKYHVPRLNARRLFSKDFFISSLYHFMKL
jgi:hypothetical protein